MLVLALIVLFLPAGSTLSDEERWKSTDLMPTVVLPSGNVRNYCNRTFFERDYQSLGLEVPDSVTENMRRNCNAIKCSQSKALPFLEFLNKSIDHPIYSFGIKNILKDDECWYYLLELENIQKNQMIFQKYYTSNAVNNSEVMKNERFDEHYGDTIEVSLTMFPSGKIIKYNYTLPENECQVLASRIIMKYHSNNFDRIKCNYDFQNVYNLAKNFCDYHQNPRKEYVNLHLLQQLDKKNCSVVLKLDKKIKVPDLKTIEPFVTNPTTAQPLNEKMYCNRSYFERNYQFKDKIVSSDLLRTFKRCKGEGTKQCKLSASYPYFEFESAGQEHEIKNPRYSFGIMEISPDDRCWSYSLELKSDRENRTLIKKYYTYANVSQRMVKDYGLVNKKYYGDRFHLNLKVFPSGKELSYPYPQPENDCQLSVLLKTITFLMSTPWKMTAQDYDRDFWDNWNDQQCQRHYDQSNLLGISKKFCNHYNNPSEKFLKENLLRHLDKNFCTIYLKFDAESKDNNERYLWIGLSFLTIFILAVISYRCYMLRKRGSKRQLSSNYPTSKMLPSNPKLPLPIDSNISVMILHRPGCEILDKLVRDFSFVIHSYGIDVNSPLLEMSQIDAEGGIATYIQRNIDTCTYILIIVTDNVTEVVHRNHKPFDFSIKILSGLAFRSNECSRYIPIYFKDYQDIIKDIPTFLSASPNCGYKIPTQIKDLVMFMKQTEVIEEDKNSSNKLSFFLEKIKAQVQSFLSEKHSGCCEAQCQQGTISDDVSELWPTASSVTTNRIIDDTRSMSCMSALKPVVEKTEPPLENNILLVNLTEEEKVKQWRENSLLCDTGCNNSERDSLLYCVKEDEFIAAV